MMKCSRDLTICREIPDGTYFCDACGQSYARLFPVVRMDAITTRRDAIATIENGNGKVAEMVELEVEKRVDSVQRELRRASHQALDRAFDEVLENAKKKKNDAVGYSQAISNGWFSGDHEYEETAQPESPPMKMEVKPLPSRQIREHKKETVIVRGRREFFIFVALSVSCGLAGYLAFLTNVQFLPESVTLAVPIPALNQLILIIAVFAAPTIYLLRSIQKQ